MLVMALEEKNKKRKEKGVDEASPYKFHDARRGWP
jgi:hypothetical protein